MTRSVRCASFTISIPHEVMGAVEDAALTRRVSIAGLSSALVAGAVLKGGGTVDGLMDLAFRNGVRTSRSPGTMNEELWTREADGVWMRGPWRLTKSNPATNVETLENGWMLSHVDRPSLKHACGFHKREALVEAQAFIADD